MDGADRQSESATKLFWMVEARCEAERALRETGFGAILLKSEHLTRTMLIGDTAFMRIAANLERQHHGFSMMTASIGRSMMRAEEIARTAVVSFEEYITPLRAGLERQRRAMEAMTWQMAATQVEAERFVRENALSTTLPTLTSTVLADLVEQGKDRPRLLEVTTGLQSLAWTSELLPRPRLNLLDVAALSLPDIEPDDQVDELEDEVEELKKEVTELRAWKMEFEALLFPPPPPPEKADDPDLKTGQYL